ncbi:hypothetical protein ABZV75_36965 [Streptomyces flaveolus]|uniref:hypothetical protein n=1 Tax=Streptomyces flaveolus TaxID=67297 RepID=UPI0033BB23BA
MPGGTVRSRLSRARTELAKHQPAPRRGKWLRPALAAAAVATAAAVTVLVLPSSSAGGDPSTRPPSRAAVALLEDIAPAAEHGTAYGTVRDDQSVYGDSGVSNSSAANGKTTVRPLHRQEVWMSVDGLHNGLLREAGRKPVVIEPGLGPGGPGWGVSASYRDVGKLPADAGAMYAWLRKTAVVARIPGATVVPDAVDAAGRHGVAIARKDPGDPTRDEWIFDRRTHEFLGERGVATEGHPGVKKGRVASDTAVLRRAVVDRAGERP